jgi:hypothetical protein
MRLTPDIANGITSEMTLVEISAISAQVEAWLHDVVLNASRAVREEPAP